MLSFLLGVAEEGYFSVAYISCPICCSRKTPIPAPAAPMQLDPVERPVAMDILGPLPDTKRGKKYFVLIGDYFNKWKEAKIWKP